MLLIGLAVPASAATAEAPMQPSKLPKISVAQASMAAASAATAATSPSSPTTTGSPASVQRPSSDSLPFSPCPQEPVVTTVSSLQASVQAAQLAVNEGGDPGSTMSKVCPTTQPPPVTPNGQGAVLAAPAAVDQHKLVDSTPRTLTKAVPRAQWRHRQQKLKTEVRQQPASQSLPIRA